jgi:hypothetical protein
MKQVNLKYALVGQRGTLIAPTSFKSASGFKLYLSNKLLSEYEFKGNPNAKEKRKLLDDIYFKTVNLFELEKEKEIKRIQKEEARRNKETLRELEKLRKETEKKEKEAKKQIQQATGQLKFRDQTERLAKSYPSDDNQVYFVMADNLFKNTLSYKDARYLLFFKNKTLWPIIDSISISVKKRTKSEIENFIDSFVNIVNSNIESFIESPKEEIEDKAEDIVIKEITTPEEKKVQDFRYNYSTEEKQVFSRKLNKRIILHRKIVMFKEVIRLDRGESWKKFKPYFIKAFLDVYDRAVGQINHRRYKNLVLFKLFTPYYDMRNKRISHFLKRTGNVYDVLSNTSVAYGYDRLTVKNRNEAESFFEAIINTFDFVKDSYLKANGAFDTGVSGFLIEFVLDK